MAVSNHNGLIYGSYLVTGLVGAGLLAFGISSENDLLVIVGAIGMGLAAVAAPITAMLARPQASASPGMGVLTEEVREVRRVLERFGEQAALSDDARRVLYRNRERELLRRAIEEDIGGRNWNAAIILCNELADRFGYRADAADFRKRIEQARAKTLNEEVAGAIGGLDTLIVQRRWTDALAEAARIQRLYPESPRTEQLPTRVERARQEYRRDLERRLLEASGGDRPEEAMELLKELDGYLTEQDAEQYREIARGVIGKARENLAAQFKLAVQDRQWETATIIGQRILDEFPNSRMAEEIGSMIDGIRQRAAATV
ncbi:MAG: hypothetical protein AAF138_10435 [Planctomycetota bacterium]